MSPSERTGGQEDWGASRRASGAYREFDPYASYLGPYRAEHGYQAWYRGEPDAFEPRRSGEHVWHGGVLGWLGSGLRAGANWVGGQLQGWGALLGGKLKGESEELGRAMRGRGAQVGSAMERRGDEMMRAGRERGYLPRPPRSYRRPDDRVLDDVQQRIAMSGVDADEVEVEVNEGVVTLSGRVPRRFDKRVIEDLAEQVFGVREVQNHLRLARRVEEEGSAGQAGAATGGEDGHAPSPEAH